MTLKRKESVSQQWCWNVRENDMELLTFRGLLNTPQNIPELQQTHATLPKVESKTTQVLCPAPEVLGITECWVGSVLLSLAPLLEKLGFRGSRYTKTGLDARPSWTLSAEPMLPVTALPAFITIAFNHETAPPTWEKNKEHSQNELFCWKARNKKNPVKLQ